MREVGLVVLGAAVALGGQFILEAWKGSRRRRIILLALDEELHAVAFDPAQQSFGGFTSQTFDELFADIVALLPPETARRIIRYHLRMKHLERWIAGARSKTKRPSREAIEDVDRVREELIAEVERVTQPRWRRLLPARLGANRPDGD